MKLNIKKLEIRESKTDLSKIIDPNSCPPLIIDKDREKIERVANSIKNARKNNNAIVFSFGAHLIKNGLSRILIEIMKKGYVNHILANEAVAIHDWEFSYQGKTEEDVKKYMSEGQFGLWDETGKYLNKAIKFGSNIGCGYGESVGRMIFEEALENEIIHHPYKNYSVLGNAYKLKIPFSVSASIGHNIHHNHPDCDFSAVGNTSGIDYLKFVNTLRKLNRGVYISIGSAVMSPMVFEKAISAAKNLEMQAGNNINEFDIFINDIQPGYWDWKKGEPPKDNPAYYLRFFKTFNRMGGNAEYIQLDNKEFLHNLYGLLKN